MAVVDAFGTLANTTNAGLTAYFRATGCTGLTIGDVLPVLSKITAYELEYVIGEMKIWDTGSEAIEPNNCVMVKIIVYADGWMCAWFDKESVTQANGSAATFVDAQTIQVANVGDYNDQYNGCSLKITNSNGVGADDPECPDNTIFTIRNMDKVNNRYQIHEDKSSDAYHFNTGNTYDYEVYQSNGNLVWWGHNSSGSGIPTNLSNRLYRAIYEMWEVLKDSSNTTVVADTAISKAFLDDGGVFTDDTADFNDVGANDVELVPVTEVVSDAFYYGHSSKFNGLNLNIGQAAVGTAITWEYWNGAWVALSPTDNTSGYTVAGTNTVLYTPPADWIITTINGEEKFWIRARVSTASFTTQPLLTQGWVQIADSLAYTNTNLGLYSFEDTSALFCLICGVTGSTTRDAFFYNTPLLTKTIYCHVLNWGGRVYSAGGAYHNYFNVHCNGNALQTAHEAGGTYNTNGYINQNIETIDYVAGIQNVFRMYLVKALNDARGNVAAVLITN